MKVSDFFQYLALIVLFFALYKCAVDKRNNWLPPQAKLIKVLDADWKLIEIHGQKYQLNSMRQLLIPYKP